MKRLLLGLLLMTAFAVAQAGDFGYMAFQTTDGTVQTISADGLEMTFTNGQLVATSGSKTLTIDLASLAKMYFTNNGETAVTAVSADADTTADGIYSLQGIKMDADAPLAKGVYIIRKNGKTQKVTLK